MDQLLAVVDSNNEVIAYLPTREVHVQHLIHRSVIALLVDQEKKLFLLQRTDPSQPFYQHFDLLRDHLLPQQSQTELAFHLLTQATSYPIKMERINFIYLISPQANCYNEFIYVYRYRLRAKSKEVDNFFSYEQLYTLPTTPLLKTMLKTRMLETLLNLK